MREFIHIMVSQTTSGTKYYLCVCVCAHALVLPVIVCVFLDSSLPKVLIWHADLQRRRDLVSRIKEEGAENENVPCGACVLVTMTHWRV